MLSSYTQQEATSHLKKSKHPDTDESDLLIQNAVNGDRGAFNRLLNHHYDTIYRFSFHLTRQKADAEDLTHDASIKIARSIHQFKFNCAFLTWVYQIVLNTYKDQIKTQANRQNRNNQYLENIQINHHNEQPEDAIHYQDLLSTISKLPEKLKITLILIHAQHLSHSQAAEVLQCSINTVSWRIHEAKKQLKLLLEDQS